MELLLQMGRAYRGSIDLVRNGLSKKDKYSTLALSILRYVDRNPEVSQGELGKILRRDPMTMSQAVRSLQNANLVVSHADAQDKRVKRLLRNEKRTQPQRKPEDPRRKTHRWFKAFVGKAADESVCQRHGGVQRIPDAV